MRRVSVRVCMVVGRALGLISVLWLAALAHADAQRAYLDVPPEKQALFDGFGLVLTDPSGKNFNAINPDSMGVGYVVREYSLYMRSTSTVPDHKREMYTDAKPSPDIFVTQGLLAKPDLTQRYTNPGVIKVFVYFATTNPAEMSRPEDLVKTFLVSKQTAQPVAPIDFVSEFKSWQPRYYRFDTLQFEVTEADDPVTWRRWKFDATMDGPRWELIGCAGTVCEQRKPRSRPQATTTTGGTQGSTRTEALPQPPLQPQPQPAKTANLVFFESRPAAYTRSYAWAPAPGCTAPDPKVFKPMTMFTNYPVLVDLVRKAPFCVAYREGPVGTVTTGDPHCKPVPAGQLLDLQAGNTAPSLQIGIDYYSTLEECTAAATEVVAFLDNKRQTIEQAIKLLDGVTVGGVRIATTGRFPSLPLSAEELKGRKISKTQITLTNPLYEVEEFEFLRAVTTKDETLELHIATAGVDLTDVDFRFIDDEEKPVDDCNPMVHIPGTRMRPANRIPFVDLPMGSKQQDDGSRVYFVRKDKDPTLSGPVIGFDDSKGGLDIVMKDGACTVPGDKKSLASAELRTKKVTRVTRQAAPWLFVVASPSPQLKQDRQFLEDDSKDTWMAILEGIRDGSAQPQMVPAQQIFTYLSAAEAGKLAKSPALLQQDQNNIAKALWRFMEAYPNARSLELPAVMASLQPQMGAAWATQERWQKLSGTFVIVGRLRDANDPEQTSFCRTWRENRFVDLPWYGKGRKRIFWIEFLRGNDSPPSEVEPVASAKGLWSCGGGGEGKATTAADYLLISTINGVSTQDQRTFLTQEISRRLKDLLK